MTESEEDWTNSPKRYTGMNAGGGGETSTTIKDAGGGGETSTYVTSTAAEMVENRPPDDEPCCGGAAEALVNHYYWPPRLPEGWKELGYVDETVDNDVRILSKLYLGADLGEQALGWTTKDSGEREVYQSGLNRDTQAGKARFDLIVPKGVSYDQQMLTRFAALMARGAEKYSQPKYVNPDDLMEVCTCDNLVAILLANSIVRECVEVATKNILESLMQSMQSASALTQTSGLEKTKNEKRQWIWRIAKLATNEATLHELGTDVGLSSGLVLKWASNFLLNQEERARFALTHSEFGQLLTTTIAQDLQEDLFARVATWVWANSETRKKLSPGHSDICKIHQLKSSSKGLFLKNDRNWEQASTEEDLERFSASAIRHFFQYFTGEMDEDHLAGTLFNLMGYEYVKGKLNG